MQFNTLFTFCPVCGSKEFHLNNIKSKKCADCGFTYYINASAAVAAFIVNEKNELLVCIRGCEPEKGTWDLPGGFVDDNESAELAVKREIMEELNLKTINAEYLFSLPNQYTYSGFTLPTLDIFFKIKVESFKDITPKDDVEAIMFLSPTEINPNKFGMNSMKIAIKMYLDKKF